jgi:circadian clock protein KaiC
MGVTAAEQRGDVELLWCPVGELILDQLVHKLLDAVRHRRVRRLVIDGIIGFRQAALEEERMVRFWSALSTELRALGVTTVHTMETPDVTGLELRLPMQGGIAVGGNLDRVAFRRAPLAAVPPDIGVQGA